MRFDRLDLNLLVALDALVDAGSVSGAARALHLSQPAVTGALNRLREYFEDELLVLSGRRMLLTPKAQELKDPVRSALAQIRADITSPRRFNPERDQRRFNLAVSDYGYTIFVSDMIANVAQHAPNVSFEIMSPSDEVTERFERAEIDLIVAVEPFALAHHPQFRLWQDAEVIISWVDAGYDQIDEETFYEAGHAVALFGPDRRLSITDLALSEMPRTRRVDLALPTFSALPQAVVGTRRLATMHRLYAEHFARLYPIRLHEMWTELPPVVEVAQWHRVREKDSGVRWLINAVRTHAARLPTSHLPDGPGYLL